MTPEDLGFEPVDERTWHRTVRGKTITFRAPEAMAELVPVESMQREIFGATDLDIYSAGALLSLIEAGGRVITATVDGEFAGAVIGMAGYVHRKPFFLSDWMGIWPTFRSIGIGAELKRLQGALALADGFTEIAWTVDPLRAANARLNFERLGAWSDQYEEDRYGSNFGEGLYGGLPSDRLHLTWSISDPAVQNRLRTPPPVTTNADVLEVEHFKPGITDSRCLVFIPNDIDAVLAADPNAALRWRLLLRETLPLALAEGFRVTGFAAGVAADGDLSALILTRDESRNA
jgi:predicted GNAT superfamily acetyltransferase